MSNLLGGGRNLRWVDPKRGFHASAISNIYFNGLYLNT